MSGGRFNYMNDTVQNEIFGCRVCQKPEQD